MAVDGIPYTIHGVKVMFPCKAYPTQLSIMDRIMKGLEWHQHCLLESPTGSGKSLALLCSSLAWQMAAYEKAQLLKEDKNSDESTNCIATLASHDVLTAINQTPKHTLANQKSLQVNGITEEPNKSVHDIEQDEEDDFRCDSKRFRNCNAPKLLNATANNLNDTLKTPSTPRHLPEWTMETKKIESPNALPTGSDCKKKSAEKIIVPKIYFGTRTHKQVSQITRELGKTAYKHVKMCILSSREHSCIHPRVSKNPNKNEECRKLLDPSVKGETCFYYQKTSVISSQAGLKSRGLVTAWDIEDLVRIGKKAKACPYYSARELMKEADIIFCPYNYLIDPKIRYQMDIDLKDQIVILDEAHNIEDSARDSASLTIDTVDLQEVLTDLDKMIQWRIMPTHYQSLHLMCANLMRWINQNSEGGCMQDRGFEQAVLVRSGEEIMDGLKDAGITPASCTIYKNTFNEIMAADKDPANDYMKTSPSPQSVSILEGLFLVLGYLFGFDGKFLSDYRLTILKTAHFVRNERPGGWKRAGFGARKEWKCSLNFWCFNPAVVFSQIGSEARSIILTSGTLSPMSSFASELGVPFPIKLEANHVISNSQVWVGTLSVGPSNSPIKATFHSAETFSFQDDIGNVVLDVCQQVPHGVLCFFPSYNMLEKVSKRWQSTGLWSKLLQKKQVLLEPRCGSKGDFDDVLHEFYQAIRRSEGEEDLVCPDSEDEISCGAEGALFLAVCRGKVSEGLDFADNNARAVITIGIPFPNTKDLKVDLKRKYNDANSSNRGLLNGSEWYEIQAFRALNQALGRCIRHKQDWGAILLVDERFSKTPRYSNGISKWLRQRIHHYKDFYKAVNSLKNFADSRSLLPCPVTQTPTSTATPAASKVDQSVFSSDISTNKEHGGLANSTCTPLLGNDFMPDKAASKSRATFTETTPLVPASQLAGELQSTPRSHLSGPNGTLVKALNTQLPQSLASNLMGAFTTLQTTSCEAQEDKQGDKNEAGIPHLTHTGVKETVSPGHNQSPKSNQGRESILETKEVTCLSEPIRVEEVYDVECPESPDMFATPEESAQMCEEELDKNSENKTAHRNDTTDHNLDTENPHRDSLAKSVAIDGVASRGFQPEKPSNPEVNTLPAKRIRIDPNPSSKETNHEGNSNKQSEGENTANHMAPATRDCTRAAQQPAAKQTQREYQAESTAPANLDKTLHCAQCHSLLYQGLLQQQNVKCEYLASLYEKYLKRKTRSNKKRKRGDPLVDRVVWTTCDMVVTCETTKVPSRQGEVLNAMYVPEQSTIYIPIQCSSCHTSSKAASLVGIRLVLLHTESEPKQKVWFFSEAVCQL